jgi:hypothetical protein
MSGSAEMDPAEGESLTAAAVGEQSEVADLDEACGHDVEQEAADELDRVEGLDAAAAVMSGISSAKGKDPNIDFECRQNFNHDQIYFSCYQCC